MTKVVKLTDGIDRQIEVLTSTLPEFVKKEDLKGYDYTVKRISDLTKMRKDITDSQLQERKIRDWGGIASGLIGFAGIVTIVVAEKSEILASKAMSIAQKLLGK